MNPLPSSATTCHLAVLASGAGSTLQAVAQACSAGVLSARIALVISNNRDAGALHIAQNLGLPHLHLSGQTHPDAAPPIAQNNAPTVEAQPKPSGAAPGDALDLAMLQALQESGAHIVVLAGYMKKVGPRVLAAFQGRIINTHPALLPLFGGHGMYGLRVHEAVLAAGATVTGPTIHHVTAGYDEGGILAQTPVPVLAGDTPQSLAARVQAAEKTLLIQTLQMLVTQIGAAGATL